MTLSSSPEAVRPEITAKEAEPAGCCGGPAPAESQACCALDAEVKSTGGTGCGCAQKAEPVKKGCC
jgi:hypothetical protein